MDMEQLPEKTYERNLNHNYMIIKDIDPETDYGYQVKMLTDNQIKGLLPVSLRVENGIEHFYYEIQSKQTFERIYERKNISYEELQLILKSFLRLEKDLQNYLLSYDCIIIDPSYLFMDMDLKEVHFVYYPGFCKEARRGFIELVEYMLTKTDHADERAVVLIYKLYRYTRNENFVLSEISQFMEETPGMQLSKKLASQQIPKSTALTGAGVAAPWSSELNPSYRDDLQWKMESNNGLQEEEQHSEKNPYLKLDVERRIQEKKSERGLSSRVLMIVSIVISMILLGILAVEKWLELIHFQARIEMFIFAGIVVFAGMGIVFNMMDAMQQKKEKAEDKKREKKNDLESRQQKSKPVFENHPIQYRQITPQWNTSQQEISQSKAAQLLERNWSNKASEMDTQVFFEAPGETVLMDDLQSGHMLRGCDGNTFECKLEHFPVLIGRMKPYVDVAFDDQSVSKMHARLEERGGRLYLEDMNSTNGTRKNGESVGIHESVPLTPGDEILFGKVKLRYCTN